MPELNLKETPQKPKTSFRVPSQSDTSDNTGIQLLQVQRTECPLGMFCIQIRARQDAWMSINADGSLILRNTLVAPAEKFIVARDRVVIRAGNIGALDFLFNGQQLPPLGNYEQARTISFSTQGLEANVPKEIAPHQPEQ